MKLLFDQRRVALIVIVSVMLGACEGDTSKEVSANTKVQGAQINDITAVVIEDSSENNSQIKIGNTQYLFDVSNHTAEEMEALLARAEEIRETHAEGYDDLEIVLILHDPDINIFTQVNYTKHKPVVDLAAKLDAFEIIDMKICETTVSSMGVEHSDVPAFIESVPFAPDEIRRLTEEGYINL